MAQRANVPQGLEWEGSLVCFPAPRPHPRLVLASTQRWAMANSQDNTNPNQSETPVERFRAGTRATPRGPHQQRHTAVALLNHPGPQQVQSKTRVLLGLPPTCQSLPYFSGAMPNHNCLKRLFKKMMGVTLGGNRVNRYLQRWVLRKEDDFNGKWKKTKLPSSW